MPAPNPLVPVLVIRYNSTMKHIEVRTKAAPKNMEYLGDVPESERLVNIPDVLKGYDYSKASITLAVGNVGGELDESLKGKWYLLMCLEANGYQAIHPNENFSKRYLKIEPPLGNAFLWKTGKKGLSDGGAESAWITKFFQTPNRSTVFLAELLTGMDILN